MNLRKVLFWDTDHNKLNCDKHPAYVIERVARYGTLEEWKEVLDYYGEEKIKSEILLLRDLDKKTLNYLSFRFKIPKQEFRCYSQKK